MTYSMKSRFSKWLLSVLSALALLSASQVNAQEEELEPQTFFTGYASTIAEFTNQPEHRETNQDVGVGLAEVGFLISHKPTKEIELKSTFVWEHSSPDLQSLLVEAYGTYTFGDKFKVGVGKFLTPLSPVNTYFYAPLNPSISLPMVIANHNLTPRSISGLQVSGQFGNELKIDYNVTYGSYDTNQFIRRGIINLMGNEVFASAVPGSENLESQFDLGGSARLAFDYDFVSLGLNYFEGTRSLIPFFDFVTNTRGEFASRRWSTGADLHFNINDRLKFNAEYWVGTNKTIDDPINLNPNTGEYVSESLDVSGYYAELLYTIGKFTPYIRYERTEDVAGLNPIGNPTLPANQAQIEAFGFTVNDWGTLVGGKTGLAGATDITAGIAYRPIYELLLKFQYRQLSTEQIQNELGSQLAGYDFNKDFHHILFSAVFSF